jgi:Ribonuclease HepT-like
MTRSDLERLRDAREFARQSINHATGLPADILAEARQPQHAALYALAIAAPEIPWDALKGLRNHVVHGYWQIDLKIIADVIEHRATPLIAELDKLITLIERN